MADERSADEKVLAVKLRHRLGALLLDVSFELTEPWTILFGPSGSGKSTILRAVAGLLQPEEGHIIYSHQNSVLERVLLDTQHRVCMPTHLRPVRSAAQRAYLFPGQTVEQNIRYGVGRSSRATDELELLDEVMKLFRLTTLRQRMPKDLSGGERQRVSVARAVAAAVAFDGPGRALLLLDEPFNGLDSVLRDDLALALRDWLHRWKVPVLSVSHDVAESFLLGAEVIRMAEGQVVEQGPVATVLASERQRIMTGLEA